MFWGRINIWYSVFDVACVSYSFSEKPQRGLTFLQSEGLLGPTPLDVAKFFHDDDRLDKNKIGEYLGDLGNKEVSLYCLQSIHSINIWEYFEIFLVGWVNSYLFLIYIVPPLLSLHFSVYVCVYWWNGLQRSRIASCLKNVFGRVPITRRSAENWSPHGEVCLKILWVQH